MTNGIIRFKKHKYIEWHVYLCDMIIYIIYIGSL